MQLRHTVNIIFLSLALLFMAIQLLFSHVIIRSGFADLERSEVAADVRRARNGILGMIRILDRFVWDWASWDATYAFVRDKNPQYMQENLMAATYAEQELNAIVLWNERGEVVYGRAVDDAGQDDGPLLRAILDFTAASTLAAIGDGGGEGGFILVGKTPLLMARRPVLRSDGQGPPRGALLMARLLTEDRVEDFARHVELPLQFHARDETSAPEQVSRAWQTLGRGRDTLVFAEGETAEGFGLLEDAAGRPSLLVRITEPRSIMAEGKKVAFYNIRILAVVILVYSLAAVVLIRRRILVRLCRLADQVRRIGGEAGYAESVVVDGRDDEIFDLGNSVNLMLGKIRETTAHLENTNAELSALLDNIPDLVWLKSVDGVLLGCNPAFAHVLGVSRADIRGKTDYDLVSRDLAESFRERDRKAIEAGGPLVNEEWLAVVPDGGRRAFFETIKAPVYDAGGNILGVLGIARDITARKQAEAQRDEFERMFRHDLHSPLASIYNLAELMRKEGNFGPEQDTLLQALEYAGYKMLGLVDASLALRKMEEGAFELGRESFNLLRELERITTLFELSRGRKGEIVVGVEGRPVREGEAVLVRGDAILCFSMLNNLMDNAMEAAPRGTRISVDLARRDGEVFIAIHNQGAVPEAIRNRFFDKFITSGKVHGTGLGTYSAKLIAEAHGGGISMRTSGEEGTTVTVRLPEFTASEGG